MKLSHLFEAKVTGDKLEWTASSGTKYDYDIVERIPCDDDSKDVMLFVHRKSPYKGGTDEWMGFKQPRGTGSYAEEFASLGAGIGKGEARGHLERYMLKHGLLKVAEEE